MHKGFYCNFQFWRCTWLIGLQKYWTNYYQCGVKICINKFCFQFNTTSNKLPSSKLIDLLAFSRLHKSWSQDGTFYVLLHNWFEIVWCIQFSTYHSSFFLVSFGHTHLCVACSSVSVFITSATFLTSTKTTVVKVLFLKLRFMFLISLNTIFKSFTDTFCFKWKQIQSNKHKFTS